MGTGDDIRDGMEVYYTGSSVAAPGLNPGDTGRVLMTTDTGSHVKWADNSVALLPNEDLEPVGDRVVEADLADSLWLADESASTLYSESGVGGLVASLDSSGVTDALTEIAAEAVDEVRSHVAVLVAARARGLDEEALDDVTSHLTARLIRDVLGGEDDG